MDACLLLPKHPPQLGSAALGTQAAFATQYLDEDGHTQRPAAPGLTAAGLTAAGLPGPSDGLPNAHSSDGPAATAASSSSSSSSSQAETALPSIVMHRQGGKEGFGGSSGDKGVNSLQARRVANLLDRPSEALLLVLGQKYLAQLKKQARALHEVKPHSSRSLSRWMDGWIVTEGLFSFFAGPLLRPPLMYRCPLFSDLLSGRPLPGDKRRSATSRRWTATRWT